MARGRPAQDPFGFKPLEKAFRKKLRELRDQRQKKDRKPKPSVPKKKAPFVG